MFRIAIDVGPEIEHPGVFALRGQGRADSRTVDAGQHFKHEPRRGHEGAGIAGADAGVRLALLDQVDGDAHGGVFLVAQRVGRQLVHVDALAGMTDRQVRISRSTRLFQSLLQGIAVTDQDDVDIAMLVQRQHGSRHHDLTTDIPAHGVEGNRDPVTHDMRVAGTATARTRYRPRRLCE